MNLRSRKSYLVFGTLFGAWLGFLYAFTSQAVNWLVLPGIPLAPTDSSLEGYLFQYTALGGLLGLVTSLPENKFIGMGIGGAASAALVMVVVLIEQWGLDSFGSSLLLLVIGFMPLTIILMSMALVVRLGVDAQVLDPDRPHLWARRILVPLVISVVAVLIGTISLFPERERIAFRYVDQLVQEGQRASSEGDLPVPLRDVRGFRENARGPYTLSWSDRVDTFFGPRPAGDELSQFLIIARFDNGFALACIFSPSRMMPNCTTY